MPRYIVTCNFQEFQIHDQNKPGQDPEVIQLDALQDATYHMEFLLKKEHGFNIKLKKRAVSRPLFESVK